MFGSGRPSNSCHIHETLRHVAVASPYWSSHASPTFLLQKSQHHSRHRLLRNLYISAPPAFPAHSFILPSPHNSQARSPEHKKASEIKRIIKTSKSSMGAGMKHARDEEIVSLALSLNTDSPTTSSTTSADSSGAAKKRALRGRVVATSGEGEFVCTTCGRAFASFQALGGHRTSHLRGRHGLELGVGVAKAIKERKRNEQHECHICGLGFEMGQALGGHMRRHREEMALSGGGAGGHDQWVIARPGQEVVGHPADRPPVLLELFV